MAARLIAMLDIRQPTSAAGEESAVHVAAQVTQGPHRLTPSGSRTQPCQAVRSAKAGVTAAVRLETGNYPPSHAL
jgi:hypothetical protein